MNGAPTARADRRRRGQAPSLVLAVLAGATALALAVQDSVPAQAQSSPRPSITVAAAIAAQPAAQVPFPIGVGPPGALPGNSFVRVRGLPPTAALSDGHSIAPGAWAVPLSALPNLQIMLPAGGAGRSEVVITLVAVDGTVLAEERLVLTVGPARQPEKAETRREATPPPASASILRAGAPLRSTPESAERDAQPTPPAAQKPATPQDKERALRLMKKGDEELAQGDVASARLLYERAADAGSAQGAMALAATFDPAELERLKVRGIAPDTTAARRWYERARELGASGAEERLRRIGAK